VTETEVAMGFVYNNPTEAMARTYLEMNGWLVQNSLFTDLLLTRDGRSYRLEADVIGYRSPGMTIRREDDQPAPVDDGADAPADSREFFAGKEPENYWVYCELKANFLDVKYAETIRVLTIGKGKTTVGKKRKRVADRFNVSPPTVVIMAYNFTDELIEQIRANGWYYKNLSVMFNFILRRFHEMWNSKARLAYNDPWLDMVKHLAFHGYEPNRPNGD
jgi:hypothetical protein